MPTAKSGWLVKKGSSAPYNWKKRFFVLDFDGTLVYKAHDSLSGSVKGAIHLTAGTTIKVDASGNFAFDIIAPGHTLKVRAESEEEKQSWVQILNEIKSADSHVTDDETEGSNVAASNLAFRTFSSHGVNTLAGYMCKKVLSKNQPGKKGQRRSLLPRKKQALAVSSEVITTWQSRWFVLRGDVLAYFKDKDSAEPKFCCLLNTECFIEETEERPFAFTLNTTYRTLHVFCSDDVEKRKWMAILQHHTSGAGAGSGSVPATHSHKKNRRSIAQRMSIGGTVARIQKTDARNSIRIPVCLVKAEGWLRKRAISGKVKNWRKRYFVLFEDATLVYFKDQPKKGADWSYSNGRTIPRGSIQLTSDFFVGDSLQRKFGFLVSDFETNYYLAAEERAGITKWTTAITEVLRKLNKEEEQMALANPLFVTAGVNARAKKGANISKTTSKEDGGWARVSLMAAEDEMELKYQQAVAEQEAAAARMRGFTVEMNSMRRLSMALMEEKEDLETEVCARTSHSHLHALTSDLIACALRTRRRWIRVKLLRQ
jgi:hypothetical protein